MSGNAIGRFERRFEDWIAIHPIQGASCTSTETVAEFVSRQTGKVVQAQLKAADRIIASQDRIASGIDHVALSLDRVSEGIEGLASAFDWGFSEMVWQLEQQRKILQEILEVLRAPLGTQAKELRERAEDAYRNGWIDDALEDFMESEKKNRYDFTIHHYIGNIFLFHKKSPDKALEYFAKAVKYATPKSPYHASLALLHVGLVHYLKEDFERAHQATSKAIELYPDLHEAYYQRAQYCANLGKYDEAIENLEKAIEGDWYYSLKVYTEKDFDGMREQLRSLFEDWCTLARKQAESEVKNAQELILYAESTCLRASGKDKKFTTARKKLNTATKCTGRDSLLDYWDALDETYGIADLVFTAMEEFLSAEIDRVNKKHEVRFNEAENIMETWTSRIFIIVPIVGFILFSGFVVVSGFVEGGVVGGIFLMLISLIGLVIIGALGLALLSGVLLIVAACARCAIRRSLNRLFEDKLAPLRTALVNVKDKREGAEEDIEGVRQFAATMREEAERDGKKGDYSKEQLWELYRMLPKDLREATFSEKVGGVIHDTCRKNSVTDADAIAQVIKEVGHVFLGLRPPNEFQTTLQCTLTEELNLSKPVAQRITNEIRRSAFLPVQDSLEALYEMKM